MARYEAALAGNRLRGSVGIERAVPGSLSALVASYYASAAWSGLSDITKRTYRGVIEELRTRHGDKRIAHLKRRNVMALMAEKALTPAAANNRLKCLRQLLDHALDLEWIEANPARTVKPYRLPEGGFHTWDDGEIARFLLVHREGSTAHLAMVLMLYTGASRADACRLGWRNVRDDRIEYRRAKTVKRTGVVVSVPIHPVLRLTLDHLPRDAFTFLQTVQGAARSPDGLGRSMRKWCDAAGLPQCASHGLRKGIARRLVEAGATGPELIAVTGHKSIAEVQPYIEAANRVTMADAAMGRIGGTSGAQNVANHPNRFAKNLPNQLKGKDE